MYSTNKILLGDWEADVYREYKTMLSIGISEQEAERRIIEYFLCSENERVFWLAFAHTQWMLGRLSLNVKEKAFEQLERLPKVGVIGQVDHLLQSTMPPPKKVRKPTVQHCPWKAGSLLAYRIISNKTLSGHPCFGKYALLRVIKIDRNPLSRLVPSELYDEIMRVCAYGWIGDHIPDPKIAESLQIIPTHGNSLSVYFDWTPSKRGRPEITCLDCDSRFIDNPPSGINLNAVPSVFTHCLPFDIALAQRLSAYL